jgi:hypothetical protein
MATAYNYDITAIPSGKVDIDRLTAEIQDSNITIALDYILINNNSLDIVFKAALSAAEQVILDDIVANHSGEPLVPINVYDPIQLSAGNYAQTSVLHRFGRTVNMSTTDMQPVAIGNTYPMKPASQATALRIKAGDPADETNSSGARAITLEGIDETGNAIIETLDTTGAVASATTAATFTRLTTAYVSESGSFSAAHVGRIEIEDATGSEIWATIAEDYSPRGVSEIAAYSVPNGTTAFVRQIVFATAIDKEAFIVLYAREQNLSDTAPYAPWRAVQSWKSTQTLASMTFDAPIGPFSAQTRS